MTNYNIKFFSNSIPFKEYNENKVEYKYFKENNRTFLLSKTLLIDDLSREEDSLNSKFILDKIENELIINNKLRKINQFIIPIVDLLLNENGELITLIEIPNDWITLQDFFQREEFKFLNKNDKLILFKKLFSKLTFILNKLNILNIVHLNLNPETIFISPEIFTNFELKGKNSSLKNSLTENFDVKVFNFGKTKLTNNYEAQIQKETYTVYNREIDKFIFYKSPERFFNLWKYTRFKKDNFFKDLVQNFDKVKTGENLKFLLDFSKQGRKVQSVYVITDELLNKINDNKLNSLTNPVSDLVGNYDLKYNQLLITLDEEIDYEKLKSYYGNKITEYTNFSFLLTLDLKKESESNLFKVLMYFNEFINNSQLFNNLLSSLYAFGFLMLYFWVGEEYLNSNLFKEYPVQSIFNIIQEKIYPKFMCDNNGTIFSDGIFNLIPDEKSKVLIKTLLQIIPEKRLKNFNFII